MKRIISALLVCVLLVGVVFALASCGKTISGKYVESITKLSYYEFSGSKYTYCVGENVRQEGTYKIDEESGKITFTYEIDGEKKTNTENFSSGEEDGVKYIKIGLLKYNKK